MTVSRVLNGQDNVRADTKAKVEAVIEKLGYMPNSAARKLAGATQLRIALVYGNPSHGWLSEVLLGCIAEAGKSDVHLLLEQCANEAAALALVGQAAADRLDGVILPPPFCDNPAVVTPLLAANIAVAVLATGAPLAGTFAVMIDEHAAAYDMTCHLLELSHRRIGFITGDPRQTGSSRRLEGYRLALERCDIGLAPELVVAGDYTYRSGLVAANQLLALPVPPSAIFASNDDMAAAVIAAAHRHHRDVPGDISVVGFDDTALAMTISPELTTVRQPIVQMAQAAVAMLASAAHRLRAGRPAKPEHRVFQHDIIVRQSATAMIE